MRRTEFYIHIVEFSLKNREFLESRLGFLGGIISHAACDFVVAVRELIDNVLEKACSAIDSSLQGRQRAAHLRRRLYRERYALSWWVRNGCRGELRARSPKKFPGRSHGPSGCATADHRAAPIA